MPDRGEDQLIPLDYARKRSSFAKNEVKEGVILFVAIGLGAVFIIGLFLLAAVMLALMSPSLYD